MKTTDRQTTDFPGIDNVGRPRSFEVELLAAGGIAAEVAYVGDAKGCPHCQFQVNSDAPDLWAA